MGFSAARAVGLSSSLNNTGHRDYLLRDDTREDHEWSTRHDYSLVEGLLDPPQHLFAAVPSSPFRVMSVEQPDAVRFILEATEGYGTRGRSLQYGVAPCTSQLVCDEKSFLVKPDITLEGHPHGLLRQDAPPPTSQRDVRSLQTDP